MIDTFAGKVAVITGAASGIGRALAQCAAEARMKLVLADVETEALEVAASELKSMGAEVCNVRTDVSQADSVAELAEKSFEAFGTVHLLCNNAGVFAGGLSWLAPQSDYEWVFGVNAWGIVNALRSFLPHMIEHGEPGHVLNTVSMAGLTISPFSAPYAMSKHAALALSETLFLELRGKQSKIGVSALCPELVSTGIGRAERNRPGHLQRKPGEGDSPERDIVEGGIRDFVHTGLEPRVLAERAMEAIREDRLYVLAPESNPWRVACDARLDDLRAARNPRLVTPGAEG